MHMYPYLQLLAPDCLVNCSGLIPNQVCASQMGMNVRQTLQLFADLSLCLSVGWLPSLGPVPSNLIFALFGMTFRSLTLHRLHTP